MKHDPERSARRRFLKATGGAGVTALLAACQSMVGQPEAGSGRSARFAYVGAFTIRAPGGRSQRADASPAVGISVYAVAANTGALASVQTVPSPNPAYLALHPSQRYLYAVNEIRDFGAKDGTGSIEAYAIDEQSGRLQLVNRQAVGAIPAHLAPDPAGRFLVIATYVGGTFQVLPIRADGGLDPVTAELAQVGSGPHQRQQAPHPHSVVFDPAGRFIAAADLGIDKVEIFRLDAGRLARVGAQPLPAGSGPRHLAFHPDGRTLYVINELNATITAFRYDPATGTLGNAIQTVATVPADFPANKSTAEIRVHSSGRFLYGSNRRFEAHPLADSVAKFKIGATGALEPIGHLTEGIAFPRTMNFDPTGTWLYVLNQKGDTIVQYAVSPATGDLVPTGRVTDAVTPACIVFKQ